MLPTPSTSHVSFDTIYEPAEDSFLFLDTLSSPSESSWLKQRFSNPDSSSPTPLILEIGTGSGVVLGFVAANSREILGRSDALSIGTDVNRDACQATRETVRRAIREREDEDERRRQQQSNRSNHTHLASITADLGSAIRPSSVDVLLFNPPYVPTEELPCLPSPSPPPPPPSSAKPAPGALSGSDKFEHDSYLLSLTYAGGADGMEITNRLLRALPGLLDPVRGVAYVLLCRQNRPEVVMEAIRGCGGGWMAEVVGGSGLTAGWERLVIVRIWRG